MGGTVYDDARAVMRRPDVETTHNVTVDFIHPVSEVIQALLDTGFVLRLFHEYRMTVYPRWPWLETSGDGVWRMPPGRPAVPLMYSLLADAGRSSCLARPPSGWPRGSREVRAHAAAAASGFENIGFGGCRTRGRRPSGTRISTLSMSAVAARSAVDILVRQEGVVAAEVELDRAGDRSDLVEVRADHRAVVRHRAGAGRGPRRRGRPSTRRSRSP